ncbi:MAG: LytR C-terminal domain-containing protein [Actinomycetota bacterium]
MTASGRYASPDSSFGRSTSNAAARGGALIAVAVVIGFLLLWQGGVGGSGAEVDAAPSDDTSTEAEQADESSDGEGTGAAAEGTDGGESTESSDGTDGAETETGTDGTENDTGTEETPTTTLALRPPGEVRAAVANGTSTAGLAGTRSGDLATAGYVTAAVNAANDTAVSNIYYLDTYGNEAEQIAILLNSDASVLRPATAEQLLALVREDNQAQIEGYHVVVVLGSDQVLG